MLIVYLFIYLWNTYRKKFWMTKPLSPVTTLPLQLSVPKAGLECACAADHTSAKVEVILHNFEGLL